MLPSTNLKRDQQESIVNDRRKRDEAWEYLNSALDEVSDEEQLPGDVLDTPAVQADSFQVLSLARRNLFTHGAQL